MCLDDSAQHQLRFNIKNYNQPKGLSTTFFTEMVEEQFYKVSGPFGKGLEPAAEGTNIAFAAGTGVLTFMDYVATVARKVLERPS